MPAKWGRLLHTLCPFSSTRHRFSTASPRRCTRRQYLVLVAWRAPASLSALLLSLSTCPPRVKIVKCKTSEPRVFTRPTRRRGGERFNHIVFFTCIYAYLILHRRVHTHIHTWRHGVYSTLLARMFTSTRNILFIPCFAFCLNCSYHFLHLVSVYTLFMFAHTNLYVHTYKADRGFLTKHPKQKLPPPPCPPPTADFLGKRPLSTCISLFYKSLLQLKIFLRM